MITVEAAAGRFERWSGGQLGLDVEWLPSFDSPRPLGRYRRARGLGQYPYNSQGLVEDLLDAVSGDVLQQLRQPGVLPVVFVSGFRAHVWHLRRSRKRFAVVPEDASVGVLCHELGHLICCWPDLDERSGVGDLCLMARGARRDQEHEPSMPCAPLRLASGWCSAKPVTSATRVDELSQQEIGLVQWNGIEMVVERRRVSTSQKQPDVLLLTRSWRSAGRINVREVGRVTVPARGEGLAVVGLLGPSLRALSASCVVTTMPRTEPVARDSVGSRPLSRALTAERAS